MVHHNSSLCDLCEADRLTKLSAWSEERGDYNLAAACLQRAVAVKQIATNIDQSEIANNFHNLGLLYAAVDDEYNAERFLLKALQQQITLHGVEHIDTRETITSLNELSRSLDVYAFVEAPHLAMTARTNNNVPILMPERRKTRKAC